MRNLFKHDIILGDGKVFNTICGNTCLRNQDDESYDLKIQGLENEIINLEPVYTSMDTCFVYILFSLRCNLNCIYCFEKDVESACQDGMEKEQLLELYKKFLIEIKKKYQNVNVILYGGEPLLQENYECIESLLDFIEKEQMSARIITNGLELRNYMNLFDKYADVIKNVTITIDGSKTIHDLRRTKKDGAGSYSQILDNVKLMCAKSKISLRIRINLDKDNRNCQDELIKELIAIENSDLTVCYYRVTNNTDSYESKKLLKLSEFASFMDDMFHAYKGKIRIESGVNAYNHVKNLLEEQRMMYPRLSYCEQGYVYLLHNDCNIYTCEEAVLCEEFKLCSIEEFLHNSSAYRQKKPKSVLTDSGKCKDCSVNVVCGGGCKFAKYSHAGYCDKSEIIQMIYDMYNRRKGEGYGY